MFYLSSVDFIRDRCSVVLLTLQSKCVEQKSGDAGHFTVSFITNKYLISPDSVYVAAELQTATQQTNSIFRSDPIFLNTDKKGK